MNEDDFDGMMLDRKLDYVIGWQNIEAELDYILNLDGEPCCEHCGYLSIKCKCRSEG